MALFIQDDGGRAKSSLQKTGGHCMPIAIATVTGCSFDDAWRACAAANALTKPYQIVGLHSSAIAFAGKRNLDGGTILGPAFQKLMRQAGFSHTQVPDYQWLDCDSAIFAGGRFVMVSQDHAFSMIGGAVHGEFDPQTLRSYKRFGLYHYWQLNRA